MAKKKKLPSQPLLQNSGHDIQPGSIAIDFSNTNTSSNDDPLAEIDRLAGRNDSFDDSEDDIDVTKLDAAGRLNVGIQRYTESPLPTPVGTPVVTSSYIPADLSSASSASSRASKGVPDSLSLNSDQSMEDDSVTLDALQHAHPVSPSPKTSDQPLPGSSDNIDLFSRQYYGIIHNYIAVAFLYASTSGLLYPIFKVVLGLKSYQLKGASSLQTIWWSFKVFFGCLSDCIPILGYRRKYYIIFGWALALFSTIGTALLGQPEPGDEAWPYVLSFSATNLFYIIADVAMDGMVTDLAKFESDEKRGRLQSTIYFVRSLGMSVTALIISFGFSSPKYGGEFSFSFELYQYLIILCVVNAMGLPFYLSLKERAGYKYKSYWKQFYNMYERLHLAGVYRIVIFSFSVHALAYVSNAAIYDIEKEWCHVEPYIDGLFNNVLSSLMMALGMWITKTYLLQVSWRKTLAFSITGLALLTYIPQVIIDLGLVRSQYFFGGSILASQTVLGIFFIVCSLAAVEVAEKGSEAAMYALLTTVGNLSVPFTSIASSQLASFFDLYDNDGNLKDDTATRHEMLKLDTTILVIQLCALFTIFILPNQKKELRRLIESGKSSKTVANIITVLLILCMAWSLTGSLLQVLPSTSCLKIVGGKGC